MENVNQNYLQDNKIIIFQPQNGYKASTDGIFLSSLVEAQKNDNILDVGSGTGAIALCLAHRFKNKNVQIIGLEKQAELCNLSGMSAKENGFESFLSFINADIAKKIDGIKNCSFQHVISNPPYSETDMKSPNESKAEAHNFAELDLESWLKFCIKMIKPQGFLYLVYRAESLAKILQVLSGKVGNIKIVPWYSKNGQEAKRIMIVAQKDSKKGCQILPPLVLHNDDGSYTDKAQAILRHGASFFE